MDDFWGLGSQFASPDLYNLARSSYPHAYQDPFRGQNAVYRDPEEFYNPAGFARPASAYHAYHPPPRRHQHSPDAFSQPLSPHQAPRRPQRFHLHESDPGYIDLRFLPGFQYHSLGPRSGYLTQGQEPAGTYGRSEQGSPRRPRPRPRQVAIEDDDPAKTGIAGLPFAFGGTNPGARYSQQASQPASHRSQAASESDDAGEADDLESEQQRLLFLRQQQQLKERRLRQQKEQQDQEYRAAKEAQERRFRERVEQLIAQDERRADEERERRRAQQLHEAQRQQGAQQQLQYQRLQEQELWHQQQERYEAERRQRLQVQRRERQSRQEQLAEQEYEAHRREQEEQERYIAQQQQLLREQQQQRRRARQAEAESQLRQPTQQGKAESSGAANAQHAQHAQHAQQQAGGLTADQIQQQPHQSFGQQQQQRQAGGLFADRLQPQQGSGKQQQKRQGGGLTVEQLQQQKFDELYQQWSQLQAEQAKHHSAAKAQQPKGNQQQAESGKHHGVANAQQPRERQQQQEGSTTSKQHTEQAKHHSAAQLLQPRDSQQQEEDSRIVEQLESKASLKPDDTVVIIQKLLRGQRLRNERPLLEKLLQANNKLNNVASRLEAVIDRIDALRHPESSQPMAKLKHFEGQQESPEQLQKQLLELSELSMQVVLSMDDLHSEAREVRSLRKRMVKRALALMEQIDITKAGMLRSVMDTHLHDDQSEFSNFESDSDAASNDHPNDAKAQAEEGGEHKQQTGDESTGPKELTAEEKSDELVTNALNQLNMAQTEGINCDQAEQHKETGNGTQDTSAAGTIQNGHSVGAEDEAVTSRHAVQAD